MKETSRPVPDEEPQASEAVREAARRRRLAAVFGDVLPEGARDEKSGAWGDPDGGRDDEWFTREVPPHHG
ncbi:MAG TPA: hypothetical protein VFG63_05660 [Nocardioidaceae bacterium]|nr:hypothetical protein [Nocardioidaceae bacterium]